MDCGSWSLLANEALGPFILLWPMINDDLPGVFFAYASFIRLLHRPAMHPVFHFRFTLLYLFLSPPLFFNSLLFQCPSLGVPCQSHISSAAASAASFSLLAPSLIHLSAFNFPLSPLFPCLTAEWVQLSCYWGVKRAQSGGTVCQRVIGRRLFLSLGYYV